jgi:hypothetical protein
MACVHKARRILQVAVSILMSHRVHHVSSFILSDFHDHAHHAHHDAQVDFQGSRAAVCNPPRSAAQEMVAVLNAVLKAALST